MVLTTHQLFHLNAIINDSQKLLDGDIKTRDEHALTKEIKIGNEVDYFLSTITDVNNIIKTKIFPKLNSDAEIHDYIEKDTKEVFK